jgi:hypothetical protein
MTSVIVVSVVMPSVIMLNIMTPLHSQKYYTRLIKNSTPFDSFTQGPTVMPISIMMSVIAIIVIMPCVIVLRVAAPLHSQTYYTRLIKKLHCHYANQHYDECHCN